MKKFILFICFFMGVQLLNAQTLEPRLYSNMPIGLNVILIGYGHSQGAIPENQNLGLEDPNLNINSTFLAYGKSFDVMGRNAKFDLIMPYSSLDGTALEFGNPVSRKVRGMADTKARFTLNLLGAPALGIKEFSSYKADTVVGVSIQVTIPTGQDDSVRLINIGANRWALKPSIGISKTISKYTESHWL
jgi:hypothetical protein